MNKTIKAILDENSTQVPRLKPRVSSKARLFITAFLQVFLVTANTYFVSRVAWLGIAAASFGISYIWTMNVRRINASNFWERIAYSTGAMCGGVMGVFVSKYIIN